MKSKSPGLHQGTWERVGHMNQLWAIRIKGTFPRIGEIVPVRVSSHMGGKTDVHYVRLIRVHKRHAWGIMDDPKNDWEEEAVFPLLPQETK